MASYFTLTLDTTGPASPSISLDGGAEYATAQLVTATISTSDSPTTNYKWSDGDVPDLSGSSMDYLISLMTFDGGTTWLGMLSGRDFS